MVSREGRLTGGQVQDVRQVLSPAGQLGDLYSHPEAPCRTPGLESGQEARLGLVYLYLLLGVRELSWRVDSPGVGDLLLQDRSYHQVLDRGLCSRELECQPGDDEHVFKLSRIVDFYPPDLPVHLYR